MISWLPDERLLLLKMLGTDFRVYLECRTCRAIFLHGNDLPPAEGFVICPNCSSVCSGISYPRAIGILEEEKTPRLTVEVEGR